MKLRHEICLATVQLRDFALNLINLLLDVNASPIPSRRGGRDVVCGSIGDDVGDGVDGDIGYVGDTVAGKTFLASEPFIIAFPTAPAFSGSFALDRLRRRWRLGVGGVGDGVGANDDGVGVGVVGGVGHVGVDFGAGVVGGGGDVGDRVGVVGGVGDAGDVGVAKSLLAFLPCTKCHALPLASAAASGVVGGVSSRPAACVDQRAERKAARGAARTLRHGDLR